VTDASLTDDNVRNHDVPERVFVASNYHTYETRQFTKTLSKDKDSKTFPENVTQGFRNNFWRVFSSLTEYDKEDFNFTWLGRNWRLISIWVSESRDVDFATYLDDKVNIFLVFVLEPAEQPPYTPITKLIFENELNEQLAFEQLLQCFRNHSFYAFLRSFQHNVKNDNEKHNGFFHFSCPHSPVPVDTAVAFFSFYAFCLLMTWRIGREQTRIQLHIEQKSFRKEMRSVLRIRSQIINVQRYFLTRNISNEEGIKKLAKSIRDKFGIETKIGGFLPLNESMEQHLRTAAQVSADVKATVLNVIVFSFAAISLPISLMSMLLTISDQASIIKNGEHVLIELPAGRLFGESVALCIFIIVIVAVVVYVHLKRKGDI
jgi:hypothetical protein